MPFVLAPKAAVEVRPQGSMSCRTRTRGLSAKNTTTSLVMLRAADRTALNTSALRIAESNAAYSETFFRDFVDVLLHVSFAERRGVDHALMTLTG